ncbi:MAG: MFS transporter [Bacteroidales bacterium]|nr:MFS transporter [Bacteroidales bacterium]
MPPKTRKYACWIALACLVVPMFASYFFDDMFSTISYLFEDPSRTQLGWDAMGYGLYTSGYSVLCVFGGLVVCGILLDKWGVRVTGSIFVGMMAAGAATVLYAITAGLAPERSLRIAYAGCMFFGLGSEIAGTAVTRSIAKWFRHGPMALAMGLQLAIARLGTALALVLSPRLVVENAGHVYSLSETARPAVFGLGLMAAGLILWALFVAMDAREDHAASWSSHSTASPGDCGSEAKPTEGVRGDLPPVDNEADKPEEGFRMNDVVGILKNSNFWLVSLLCVLFYSSIIAFKKFAGAILIPRFGIPAETAGWMVSMLPFATVIFAPLFGLLVDRFGKGTRWMLLGSVLALTAHLLLAFAPQGVPFFGYLAMVLLGFGYSLVPAALWPSVPKIVPDKVLGTTFALVYWVQNLGLLAFKMLAGLILGAAADTPDAARSGAVSVELMFTGLCVAAVAVALLFARSSRRHPELALDAPNKA